MAHELTVAELIHELKRMPGDAIVRIGYNYGDRCGTMVTPAITHVEELKTKESSYHQMHKLIDEECDGFEEADFSVVLW